MAKKPITLFGVDTSNNPQKANAEAIPQDAQTPLQRLMELVPKYFKQKAEMAVIEKDVKADNTTIKSIMVDNNLTTFEVGDLVAKYTVTKKESFNEELLIAKIKKLKQAKGIIKKREYVDMDALENAIYAGLINAADLKACQEVKEIPMLRVDKAKGAKAND